MPTGKEWRLSIERKNTRDLEELSKAMGTLGTWVMWNGVFSRGCDVRSIHMMIDHELEKRSRGNRAFVEGDDYLEHGHQYKTFGITRVEDDHTNIIEVYGDVLLRNKIMDLLNEEDGS